MNASPVLLVAAILAAPALRSEQLVTPGEAQGSALVFAGAPFATPAARLQLQLKAADAVVLGKVVALMAAPGAPAGVSEHATSWIDAVVKADAVLKGDKSIPVVFIRFPASGDIAWADYPKLKVGDEAIYVLKRDLVSGRPGRTETVGSQTVSLPVYVVASAGKVLAKSRRGEIESLLATP